MDQATRQDQSQTSRPRSSKNEIPADEAETTPGQVRTATCKEHISALDHAARALASMDARRQQEAKELRAKIKDAQAAGTDSTTFQAALNAIEAPSSNQAVDWTAAARYANGIENCVHPREMVRFLVAAADCVTTLYDELMVGSESTEIAQEQLKTLRVGHDGEHGYGHHCLVRILEETPVFVQVAPTKLVRKKREIMPIVVVVWKADPFKLAACLADTWVVKLHYCAYNQRYLNMSEWLSAGCKDRPAWAKRYQASDFAAGYNPNWHKKHGDHTAVIPVEMNLLQKAEFFVEKPARADSSTEQQKNFKQKPRD